MADEDVDAGIIDFMDRRSRYAAARAALGVEADPDDAARSLELEGMSGIPASVIQTDVPKWDTKIHASMASDLVANDPILSAYVYANPEAAKVSSDDYHILSETGRKLKQIYGYTQRGAQIGEGVDQADWSWYKPPPYQPTPSQSRILAFGNAFREGADMSEIPTELKQLYDYMDGPLWQQAADLAPGLTATTKMGIAGGAAAYKGMEKLFTGLLYGTSAYVAEAGKQLGMSEADTNRLTRDLVAFGMVGLSGQTGPHMGPAMIGREPMIRPSEGLRLTHEAQLPPEARDVLVTVRRIARELKEYVEAQKEPPRGFNETIDDFHEEQDKAKLDALDDVGRLADQSETKNRSVDLYGKFVDIVGEGDVHVKAETLRELYGDKTPNYDDGMLGHVPDLAEKMAIAGEDGFVRIPLKDWLLASSDVKKALKDDIKLPEGQTRNEMKEPRPEYRPTDGTMLDAERKAAGLDPLFAKGEAPKPKPAKQLELDVTRMAEKRTFETAPPGISQARWELYLKAIERQRTADRAAQAEKILQDVKRTQTREWKEKRTELRSEAEESVRARPEVQMDQNIRRGGKLNDVDMTREQAKALEGYIDRENGIHPDDLAGHYDYPDGDTLVNRLIEYRKQMEKSRLRPDKFVETLIDAEADRMMQERYGRLKENIETDVRDRLYHQTQLDMIHEDTLLMAELAGQQLSLSKEALIKQMRDLIAQEKVAGLTSREYLELAGKANKLAEEAYLKGDFTEGTKQALFRENNYIRAKEVAQKWEKVRDRFDKQYKRLAKKREHPNIDQPFLDMLHSIYNQLGLKVPRLPEDIADNLAKADVPNLGEFARVYDFTGITDLIPDWAMQGIPKLKDLTVEQFGELEKMAKGLEEVGRAQQKLYIGDREAMLDETVDAMKEAVKRAAGGKPVKGARLPEQTISGRQAVRWSHMNAETILNRLDLDDPQGIFNQTLVRAASEGWLKNEAMLQQYKRVLEGLGKIPDINKKIVNDLFRDPRSEGGEAFMEMRKRHALGVLQYMGTESSKAKLLESFGVTEEQVWSWLQRNGITEKDVARSQKIGKMFDGLFDEADAMQYRQTKVGIEKVEVGKVATPWGEMDGWFSPVKYDPSRAFKSKKLRGELQEEGFFRATTPQGYAKRRTGYIDFVDLNLDMIPMRVKQMIHDITMREPVNQWAKILYDPRMKPAFLEYVGKARYDQLESYLKDLANNANHMDLTASVATRASEFFRQNAISTLTGFNMGTLAKHTTTALLNSINEVGGARFARELAILVSELPAGRESWKLAMTSPEIQRRLRTNYQDLIRGHGTELTIGGMRAKTPAGHVFNSLREFMQSAGATPVAVGDLLSAVPTWLAEYKRVVREGLSAGKEQAEAESDGMFAANRAVRRAHGSSALSNRPRVMRGGGLMQWYSSLYGFFSHMMQKQYELAWKSKEVGRAISEGEIKRAGKLGYQVGKGFFSYIIWPALVEELVTPYTGAEKDSWGVWGAKMLGLGLSSSWILGRDAIRSLVNVRDPQVGLLGTPMQAWTDLSRDMHKPWNAQNAGRIINHVVSMTGFMTGLTYRSEGTLGEYLYRYNHGLERPKGPWDVLAGARYGRTVGKGVHHTHTFQEWKQHIMTHRR